MVVSDVALPWEEGAVGLEVVAVIFALAVVSESICVGCNTMIAA